MSLLDAAVYPGKALGFFVLGASLHDVLTRVKAEPQSFPKLDLVYSTTQPVIEPVIVNLPSNGIRLRFDGPAQRLRLIEVLDFSKSRLIYNNTDIAKPATASDATPSAPVFRHIYRNLLGPTFPGEYIPPDGNDSQDYGLYVLSYPGIAFAFPVQSTAWPHNKDHVDLLSSSATLPAASMAIFLGEAWSAVRKTLYTQELPHPASLAIPSKARDALPEEVALVKILGEGRLELVRPWASSFLLILGHTTPQDLVAELGPPDAIYRKNDQRMLIHKNRTGSDSRSSSAWNDNRLQDDSTDTDQSSSYTATDVSGDESEVGATSADAAGECFYNYFYHGFDILISSPTTPSRRPPSSTQSNSSQPSILNTSAPFVATKVIIHANVPGSYPFNRHRRCRWQIAYLSTKNRKSSAVDSETGFEEIARRLHNQWKSIYANEEEARQSQRGMVLNRGWGDSPGSSCELLGGWEESAGGKRANGVDTALDGEQGLGNTTLYGFPGLVFEVLKNGTVSSLTAF